ncbi:diguanylate cyclase [bacterium]|nr:diguanylate cyclase [bacterium]
MNYTHFHIPEHLKPMKTVVYGDFEETLQVFDKETRSNIFIRTILFPETVSRELAKQLKKDFERAKKLSFSFLPHFHKLTIKKNSITYSLDEFEGEALINMLPLSQKDATTIFAALTNALIDLHGHGIYHLHLNPYTIFVDEQKRVKIIDVGFDAAYLVLIKSNLLLPYASPEMLQTQRCDWRSDFFSLGALLWHTLTGRIPQFHINDSSLIPSSKNKKKIEPFAQLLDQLLQPHPSNRLTDTLSIITKLHKIAVTVGAIQHGEKISDIEYNDDLISRQAEISHTASAIEQFIGHEVDQTIIVVGDRGTGRTRFLYEIEQTFSQKLHTLLISATATQDLLGDIIIDIWNQMDREIHFQIAKKWGAILLVYFPRMSNFPEFTTISPDEPLRNAKEDFARTVSVIVDIIHIYTRTSPLLLLIDNAEEIDGRSLEVLHELLAKDGENHHLFVVATIIYEANVEFLEFSSYNRIDLPPFSLIETKTFLTNQFAPLNATLEDETLLWFFRESQGKVRQIKMILFLLIQEGFIYQNEQQILLDTNVLKSHSISLLKRWIDSLNSDQLLLLKATSVYYKFTTSEVLCALLDGKLAKDEISLFLEMFKNNYLLKQQKNGRIRLISLQLKEFLYNLMSDEERIYFHKLFARYLMDNLRHLDTRLNLYAYSAYHEKQANNPRKALRLYLLSARAALNNASGMQIDIILHEVLAIKEENPTLLNPGQQYAIDLFAGKTYYNTGHHLKAIDLLQKAFHHWKHHTILELLIFSLIRESELEKAKDILKKFHQTSPDYIAFISFLRAVIATDVEENIRKANYHIIRVNNLIKKGFNALFDKNRLYMLRELEFRIRVRLCEHDEFEELEQLHSTLLQQAYSLNQKVYVTDALFASFQLYWQFNNLEKSYSILQKALKISIELYDNFRISRIYYHLAICSHRLSHWEECGYHLDKTMEYANKSDGIQILRLAFYAKGEYALISGNYTLADNYLTQAEEYARRDETTDVIHVYASLILLQLLKNNSGGARNIGGKMRRFMEQRSVPDDQQIQGLLALMLLESLFPRNDKLYIEFSKVASRIIKKRPQTHKTYKLLYILTHILHNASIQNFKKVYRWIDIVEKDNITSTHSLFTMLYYYHVATLLSQHNKRHPLLLPYIEHGRNVANKVQSTHFAFLFRELLYIVGRDENSALLKTIYSSAQKNSPELLPTVRKLRTHVEETEKLLDYFRVKERNFSHISELAKSIAEKSDLTRILSIVVRKIFDTVPLDICAIFYQYGEGEETEYFIRDAMNAEVSFQEINFNTQTIHKMLASGHIEITTQLIKHSNSAQSTSYSDSDVKATVAAIPLDLQGEMHSYIYIQHSSDSTTFSDATLHFFGILVDYVSVILENVRLLDIATKDTLTRVATRRHFMQSLEKEIKRQRRYNSYLSLLMLDIDHFKQINDQHGHLMGDTVLRKIGEILNQNIRNTDFVGRFGGEEFIILLTNTNQVGAFNTAEKIRLIIEETSFSTLNITASIGIATCNDHRLMSELDFIEKSDQAMYTAKREGRNRTIHYDDTIRMEQE